MMNLPSPLSRLWLESLIDPEALAADERLIRLAALQPEALTPADWLLLAEVVRHHAIDVPQLDLDVMDVCGTGGSGLSSLNSSTMVALTLSAIPAAPPVVKFGNRAVSSQSGSFNFLEALGISATLPQEVPMWLEKFRVAFVLAPDVYPGLAGLQKARKQLGQPTAFNSLGPLLNPFNPAYQLMGVSNLSALNAFPTVLPMLNPKLQRGLLVRSHSGLDELHPEESAMVRWVHPESGGLKIDKKMPRLWPPDDLPAEFALCQSLPPAPDLSKLNAQENASLWQAMSQGIPKAGESPVLQVARAMVALNAGTALWLSHHAQSLDQGILQALEILASGQAWQATQVLVKNA
jgi:anthranilate phosphoribosyltransferase